MGQRSYDGGHPRVPNAGAQPWRWTFSHAEVLYPPPQLSQLFPVLLLPVPYSPLGKVTRGRDSAQSMAAGTTTPQSRRRAAGMVEGSRDAPQEGPTTIPVGRARVKGTRCWGACHFTQRK